MKRASFLLKEHDEAASFIGLTGSGNVNVDEEQQEIEDALSELVPSLIRMTVGDFLEVGEDENCTDAVCAEDTVASIADDVIILWKGMKILLMKQTQEWGKPFLSFPIKKPSRLLALFLQF